MTDNLDKAAQAGELANQVAGSIADSGMTDTKTANNIRKAGAITGLVSAILTAAKRPSASLNLRLSGGGPPACSLCRRSSCGLLCNRLLDSRLWLYFRCTAVLGGIGQTGSKPFSLSLL